MNVVIAHPLFRDFEPLLRERLGPVHPLRFVGSVEMAEAGEIFGDTEILVSQRFPTSWGPRFPALRLLHGVGAGMDKVDFGALSPDVRVCCNYGHGASIAEYAIMVMLALVRGLRIADRDLRQGIWRSPQFNPALPLAGGLNGGTTVVLGTGEIGGAVAAMGKALQMTSIGLNRTGRPVPGGAFEQVLPMSALADVLPRADFLIVAVPLSEETRGLIGARELALLSSDAFLINVARGPVVEEAPLFQALKTRSLAGAAMDVWYQYPEAGSDRAEPSSLPFRDLDNVIMTPHLSGVTAATFRHRAGEVARNILSFAAGGALSNEVARPDRDAGR